MIHLAKLTAMSAFAMVAIYAPDLIACSCVGVERTLAERYADAKTVFLARIVSIERLRVQDQPFMDSLRARFELGEVFKGTPLRRAQCVPDPECVKYRWSLATTCCSSLEEGTSRLYVQAAI